MLYLFKNPKRALRRHHVARLKHNRKHYWGHGKSYGTETLIMTPRQLAQVVKTPTPCSCPMCGNERKHFNKCTLQEQLHKDQDDLENY